MTNSTNNTNSEPPAAQNTAHRKTYKEVFDESKADLLHAQRQTRVLEKMFGAVPDN